MIQLLVLALQVISVIAKTHTFDWSVDWITVAPDGYTRAAVGINGQWPCPTISVDIGDRVVVNLKNNLGNETTSIHWHGIFQNGSPQMDGPAMVAQCPIPPGSSFTYDFKIEQPGTYWYHSHVGGQYLDGFRGPIVVHDPLAPYASQVDEEIVLSVSDWYHRQAPYLISFFQSPLNEEEHEGSEPVPNATLINHAQNVHFPIKPDKTYLFRVINMGGFAAQFVEFEGHDMHVVEVDGVYTEPHRVSQLFLTAAQRYSVIVKTKRNPKRNFAITASMNDGMFDDGVIPPSIINDATAYLIYDEAQPLPSPRKITYLERAKDDLKFIPFDKQSALGPVTLSIPLEVAFKPNSQTQNRGYFNNITYLPPKVPTLYTALSAPPDLVSNPLIYGKHTNSYVLPHNAIVELTIINTDGGAHPFHLHSHNFQVISRGEAGPEDGPPALPPRRMKVPATPMRRDTLLIYPSSYAVIRFKADNPGITLFHCHIEWHVEAGLTMTFIEAPAELQKLGIKIPRDQRDVCEKGGIGLKGNAVGNDGDKWLDLSGEKTEPPLVNMGAYIGPVLPDEDGDKDDVVEDSKASKLKGRGWSRLWRLIEGGAI